MKILTHEVDKTFGFVFPGHTYKVDWYATENDDHTDTCVFGCRKQREYQQEESEHQEDDWDDDGELK